MWLLADIGGTHSRLALADESGPLDNTTRHYDNDTFVDLPALLQAYLAENGIRPKAACIAMAGPVSARPPRLTNRDWIIDPDTLAPLLGSRPILINDLEALALSLPSKPKSLPLIAAPDTRPNGQRLAIGIGTGMNVCPLLQDTHPMPTEYGQSPLPAPLAKALPGVRHVEELFSGRGLAAFRAQGGSIRDYSALIGTLCATLAAQYLPLDGMALAGGVARAVLTEEPDVFAETYRAACPPEAALPPVDLILSDDAALLGCHAALSQTQPAARG